MLHITYKHLTIGDKTYLKQFVKRFFRFDCISSKYYTAKKQYNKLNNRLRETLGFNAPNQIFSGINPTVSPAT